MRRRTRVIIGSVLIILVIYLTGILVHPFELDFDTRFSYEIDRKDFPELISRITDGEDLDAAEHEPISPINSYDFRYLIANSDKCRPTANERYSVEPNPSNDVGNEILMENSPRIMIIIKSSLSHFKNRDVIRKTWGFEQRFSDVMIRRVFVVGSCESISLNGNVAPESMPTPASCQDAIDEENRQNQDIVQADFIDSYYNNTIKTMVGLKWLVNHCNSSQFALFVDDDYYVSIKNLLKFLKNPLFEGKVPVTDTRDPSNLPFDGRMYAGFVFQSSYPMRHPHSKWYVSLKDYPFDRYPPYVTAGAYVLSNRAFRELATASLYVKHFKFDDIYMGLLAKKIELKPLHVPDFNFWVTSYDPVAFEPVIAAHGFGDPDWLLKVWQEQKTRNHA